MNASPTLPFSSGEAGERRLGGYLGAVRAHWGVVAIVTLLALGAATMAIALGPSQYEASAEVLVTPLNRDDQSLLGLELLRDSGDPTRDAQSAASILLSPRTAELTARRLGEGWDAGRVLEAVRIESKGDSSILSVTATAPEPGLAARIANTFVAASFDLRTRDLRRRLDALIARLEARRAADAGDQAAAVSIAERLTALETLRTSSRDPTLSPVRAAAPPPAPVGAPPWLILAAALLGGLTVGALAAVGMQLLDRRVSDQEEIRAIYPLPLLAGVPHVSRTAGQAGELPPEAFEPMRTLATQVQSYGTGRTVLITSASSGDGKSTVAANLALALAEAGHKVVIVDLDVRKPELSETINAARLDHDRADGPIVASLHGSRVRLMPAARGTSREMLARRAAFLIPEALKTATYVVIDSSPLGEVSDALPVARQVDDVILVARPRHTDRASLQVARDLLHRAGVLPRGLVLVGETLHETSSSYYMRALTSTGKEPVRTRGSAPA